jgi:hypothetical protein
VSRITVEQGKQLWGWGHVTIPQIIPIYSQQRALRAIYAELAHTPIPEGYSYAPTAAQSEAVMSLLYHTPLWPLCEELVAPSFLKGHGAAQVVVRYPEPIPREAPGELPVPHLDGLYPEGEQIDTFTMLLCVPLTATPTQYSGNFLVYNSSHTHLARAYSAKATATSYRERIAGFRPSQATHLMLTAGDAVICNYGLLHTASPNFGTLPRIHVYFRLEHTQHNPGLHNLQNPWAEWSGLKALLAKE